MVVTNYAESEGEYIEDVLGESEGEDECDAVDGTCNDKGVSVIAVHLLGKCKDWRAVKIMEISWSRGSNLDLSQLARNLGLNTGCLVSA